MLHKMIANNDFKLVIYYHCRRLYKFELNLFKKFGIMDTYISE